MIVSIVICVCFLHSCKLRTDVGSVDWPEYGGDENRDHYSSLEQINAGNLSKLTMAWTYSSVGADSILKATQMQCNPIIIDGILYAVSASTQVFALDAATGKEIWKTAIKDNGGTLSRGVTYYADADNKFIFWGAGPWLYCINATNGKLNAAFGNAGRIDLRLGVERPDAGNYLTSNTPNTIYKNLIITGMRVAEEENALLGDIRAYDVYTGKLVWTFHTIPEKGEFGFDSWKINDPRKNIGGANSWAGMVIDRERGIVYAPTGSASYDFYGGNRKGNNLFANCLLALDANTGKRLWHFQFVHHDLWDRDPPSTPNLLTVVHDGKKVDAVAQLTKQGYLFLFNRLTGEPLFPIEERPVKTDGIQEEEYSVTQPFPLKPAPFNKQAFNVADINPWAANYDEIKSQLENARTGEPYIPITGKMTIFFPGTDGGAQWGGAATDREGVIYIPSKQMPCFTTLQNKDSINAKKAFTGAELFSVNCASCHGADRKGNADGTYPSLLAVAGKYNTQEIGKLLETGRGMMPSYSHISEPERAAIVKFILGEADDHTIVSNQKSKIPYKHTGYNRWFDTNGYPVSRPPWGLLTAIDLNTGEHKWAVPLGEYKELTEKGIPITGTDNYGGPLVTASGLIFIAATKDEMFRAFDKNTGKMLWQTKLPAAGFATPSTYSVNGKQYIVIACGGGKLKQPSGDKYVAFALGD